MKRLVLVGSGHAHLAVLHALANRKPVDVEVVLLTPSSHQSNSGMLPGWMAGQYTRTQCQIDLRPLVQSAQILMEPSPVVGMDADRRCVTLPNGRLIEYDLLSLDIGSETDTSSLEIAGDRLLPIKPLDGFFAEWPRVLRQAADQEGYCLVVVGGGAAGVELALAARHAFDLAQLDGRVELVVSENGLLVGHATGVQRRMSRFLSQANVVAHLPDAVGTEEGVLLSDGTLLSADCVIAATGARAPGWLKRTKLMLNEKGYIAVDRHHQSLSHSNVFAAGDVCARQDSVVARSGVHAVHAGPIVAENLLAALQGGAMTAYRPRRRSLYLLACGPQYAIASWGPFSAEGKGVWLLKDWIDRGFVTRFSSQSRYLQPRRTRPELP